MPHDTIVVVRIDCFTETETIPLLGNYIAMLRGQPATGAAFP